MGLSRQQSPTQMCFCPKCWSIATFHSPPAIIRTSASYSRASRPPTTFLPETLLFQGLEMCPRRSAITSWISWTDARRASWLTACRSTITHSTTNYYRRRLRPSTRLAQLSSSGTVLRCILKPERQLGSWSRARSRSWRRAASRSTPTQVITARPW